MGYISDIKRVCQNEGIQRLVVKSVEYGYNKYIRSHLPQQRVTYNNVDVLASRWGDRIIPWQSTNIPEYEEGLIQGIHRNVSEGDQVVIIGGGWGVTSVVAARKVGAQGQIITYEGATSEVKKINHTIELNDVSERVNLRHGIVAEAIALRGKQGDARVIPPSDIPECDVLILDCEGAEMKIIEDLDIRPETVLVETHGLFGATKEDVRDLLQESGYKVVTEGVAEERVEDFCEENGIYVLTAEYM